MGGSFKHGPLHVINQYIHWLWPAQNGEKSAVLGKKNLPYIFSAMRKYFEHEHGRKLNWKWAKKLWRIEEQNIKYSMVVLNGTTWSLVELHFMERSALTLHSLANPWSSCAVHAS